MAERMRPTKGSDPYVKEAVLPSGSALSEKDYPPEMDADDHVSRNATPHTPTNLPDCGEYYERSRRKGRG